MKVAVTGGSGKAGRAVIAGLLEQGHEVLNIDHIAPGPASPSAPFLAADLTDYGQAIEAVSGGERLPGIEAIVHLAAIPSPAHATKNVVFDTNMSSTHNVFAAAVRLKLDRVIWASSETTLGLPFDRAPDYAPIDEAHELRPESSYALSKVLGEEMARQFNRWSGIPFIALRFSNIIERADYARFPEYWDDATIRRWNLWSYVDESHVAESVNCSLRADIRGAESFIIAAGDTVMKRPNRELMAEQFPGVPLPAELGEHETLLAIGKARRLLGYEPTFTWRTLL